MPLLADVKGWLHLVRPGCQSSPLGLAHGVVGISVSHRCRVPFTLTPILVTQCPLQPFMFNLQGCQFDRAIPVHNDKFGVVLVGLPQVLASRFQFRTKLDALVF